MSSSGLRYVIVKSGGRKLVSGNVAVMRYVVCVAPGTFLDASRKGQSFAFTLGAKQVIRGTEEAVRKIGLGGSIDADLPYKLAYGAKGRPPAIPPKAELFFSIQLDGMYDVALSTLLGRAYASGGIDAMSSVYARAQSGGFSNMYASEDDLNGLAYRMLKNKQYEGAIGVLQFNAKRFPGSWNAYDSLGDAYRMAGQTAPAIQNYKRALELNPKDDNAATYLKALESKAP
ncbi:MAG: FKBP-type peptidyl-prolyl cis-trans isomerase [Candidatus Eremiobacteraeota bacterium]|nr:FKBP-type peptidyl-prolyl cis-trans isomerase [Candidatus Eremiobacteraeota bacterium]